MGDVVRAALSRSGHFLAPRIDARDDALAQPDYLSKIFFAYGFVDVTSR